MGFNSIKPSNNSISITKTIYQGTLKTLVYDKTITQNQSDKVLAEVLKNVNESKGGLYGLSDLVISGVLNKSQANTINQRIQIDMKSNM
mgnify:CR=1 FL=1